MIVFWPWFFIGMGIWGTGLEEVTLPPLSSTSVSAPVSEWRYNPIFSAKSGVVMEVDSAERVWEKDAQSPLPMASLTKLMTALIILENHSLTEVVTVPSSAAKGEGTKMNLEEGEKITVENLLIGLFVCSANDAATTLAIYDSGSVVAFAEKMNTRAHALGLSQTHFVNPHGLDAEEHFSSALDIAFLAKYLLRFDFVRETISKKADQVASVDGTKVHSFKNTNELLSSVFPVYGMKTGTTDNAGECLVVLVKKSGKEYLMVILGSKDRYLDAKTLLYPILSGKE